MAVVTQSHEDRVPDGVMQVVWTWVRVPPVLPDEFKSAAELMIPVSGQDTLGNQTGTNEHRDQRNPLEQRQARHQKPHERDRQQDHAGFAADIQQDSTKTPMMAAVAQAPRPADTRPLM